MYCILFQLGYYWCRKIRRNNLCFCFLSIAALLLSIKAVYFAGLYDTTASGGGDIRLIKDTCVTLNPYVIGRYLLRAPFGSEGWILGKKDVLQST